MVFLNHTVACNIYVKRKPHKLKSKFQKMYTTDFTLTRQTGSWHIGRKGWFESSNLNIYNQLGCSMKFKNGIAAGCMICTNVILYIFEKSLKSYVAIDDSDEFSCISWASFVGIISEISMYLLSWALIEIRQERSS